MKRPFLTVFFFIGLGGILLGLNLGLIHLEEITWKAFIIPTILIVLGAISLDSYTKKGRDGMALLWGLFAFTYGSLLTLGVLELFKFHYGDWVKLWPILLIAYGIHQLFRNTEKEKNKLHTYWHWENDDETRVKKKRRPISSLQFNEQGWVVEPMNRAVNIGSFFFDFSKATIPIGETPIELSGNVGDIKILVSDHVAVHITFKSNVLSATIFDKKENGVRSEVEYISPGYAESDRRVRMNINYHVLDAKIKRV